MNIEWTSETGDLARRAARHAALADPARLRIMDLLALGDASPGEIQAELRMSSSLVAHHLNLLEDAGLVVRHRSEGDRRRTYLRLAPGSADAIMPEQRHGVRRVLFVCTGNSARSHLAAALWREASEVPAGSAGTRPAARIDPGAFAVAARHGLVLPDIRPTALDTVREDHDLVVTVCDTAHEMLAEQGTMHWSVSDPVRIGTDAAFDAAFEDIAARIRGLAPQLVAR